MDRPLRTAQIFLLYRRTQSRISMRCLIQTESDRSRNAQRHGLKCVRVSELQRQFQPPGWPGVGVEVGILAFRKAAIASFRAFAGPSRVWWIGSTSAAKAFTVCRAVVASTTVPELSNPGWEEINGAIF